jgi:hypothetical protein
MALRLHRSDRQMEFANRVGRVISEMTVGTVIVLMHVALADRRSSRAHRPGHELTADGRRIWRTQISP